MNLTPALTKPFVPSTPAAEHERKITKAAREFEAVLLNTVLGPLEHTFASLPGK